MHDLFNTPVGATTDPAAHAHDLAQLNRDLAACRQCALWERATQAVAGRGATGAPLMLVGEQPGNDEDLAGEPFIGPAGRLLKEAMDAAGVRRERTYVTNAVKHFKWVPQGPRRLHQKPGVREVKACHNWLAAEIRLVRPRLILCLGATAGQAIVGKGFRVGQDRGRQLHSPFGPAFATAHPSAILRVPDPAAQKEALRVFVLELRAADALCTALGNGAQQAGAHDAGLAPAAP